MPAPSFAKQDSKHDPRTCLLVVDPVSRKLSIPFDAISETLARHRTGIPSLCMLHFNGRCRQGANCHQVHADHNVVLALRTQAQMSLMCCKTHGDKAAMRDYYDGTYSLAFVGGSGNTLPITKLAMTQGLQKYIDEYEQSHGVPSPGQDKVTLSPSATTICRLHGQDRCRYGSECKFLHICKELLWAEVSAPNNAPANRRYSNNNGSNNQPSSPYHSSSYCSDSMMPPSPTQHMMGPYSTNGNNSISGAGPHHHMTRGSNSHHQNYYQSMSTESLISMDLTATPPMTPTSEPTISPVIKCKQAGDSWSYEPYGFNPIPMMPPAFDGFE